MAKNNTPKFVVIHYGGDSDLLQRLIDHLESGMEIVRVDAFANQSLVYILKRVKK